MVNDTQLHLPPLEDGGAFERLCLDLWREVWNDPHAVFHGRSGHGQSGVDIYGWPEGAEGRCAIQCKVRAPHADRRRLMRELRADVEAARAFDVEHPLHTLLIATTLDRHPALQAFERDLDDEERTRGGFRVRIYFWPDILGLLAQHLSVAQAHFPEYFVNPRPQLRLLPTPKRPAHYVDRVDVNALVERLLAPAKNGDGAVGEGFIGVQGMAGIGKTVLAAEVARHDAVVAAFPDGVFWLPVGQHPDAVLLLRRLAEALGDVAPNFRDAAKGKAWVQSLLANQRVLLVLDDVWTPDITEALDVVAPAGRTLLTTRNAEVVTWFNSPLHSVNLLGEEMALDLLAAWAGQPCDTSAATEVMRACGGLPLALAMIGAMVKGRASGWEDALERLADADLDAIVRKFPDYPYPTLFRALAVSVEALEPWQRERYVELAVFPRAPIPEAALMTLWAMAGMTRRAVHDLVATLVTRSLAQQDQQGRLTIHDLQHAYAQRVSGDQRALHRRLIDAYRRAGPWHTIQNDGYVHAHLVEHCLRAELLDDVRPLFATDAWMRARVAADDGDFYGYLRDLDAVWEIVLAKVRGMDPDRDSDLAWCFHLALVQSTIASLADDLVPEAVVRGVALGVLSLQRALVTIPRIPSAVKRFTIYAGLLGADVVPLGERAGVIAATWRAFSEIQPTGYPDRGRALAVLARTPPPPLIPRIVEEMRHLSNPLIQLEIATQLLEHGVEPSLHAQILEMAVEAAEEEEWGVRRGDGFVRRIASFLAGDDAYNDRLGDVLDQVAELKEYGWSIDSPRATGLSSIAPAVRGALFDRALVLARAMENPYGKACAFAALTPQCEPPLQQELLQAYVDLVLELPTEDFFMGCPRSSAVEELRTPLGRPDLERILDALLAIPDARIDSALLRLAPQFDAPLAMRVIAAAEKRPFQNRLLAVVLPYVGDRQFHRWFDDVLAKQPDLFYRKALIEEVLPRLSEAEQARLFEAIFPLPPSNWEWIVDCLPEKLFDRCIEVATQFFDDDREGILGPLSLRANASQVGTILALPPAKPRWHERNEAELKLKVLCADRAPAAVRMRVVEQSWKSAVQTGDGWWAVVDRLTAEDVEAALTALCALADDNLVSSGLTALAPRLNNEQRRAAAARVRAGSRTVRRVMTLCTLTEQASPNEIELLADDIVACLAETKESYDYERVTARGFKTLARLDAPRALSLALTLPAKQKEFSSSSNISIPRMIAMRELLTVEDPSIALKAAETFVSDMQQHGQRDWALEAVRALVPTLPSFPPALRRSILEIVALASPRDELVRSYALLHPFLPADDRADAVADLYEIVGDELALAVAAPSRDNFIRPPDDDAVDKTQTVRAAAALLPLLESETEGDQLREQMWETARSQGFLDDLIASIVDILRQPRQADFEEAIRIVNAFIKSGNEKYAAMMLERLAASFDEERRRAALDLAERMEPDNQVRALRGLARTDKASETLSAPVRTRCIGLAACVADVHARYELLTSFCRVQLADDRALLETAALDVLDRRRTGERDELCRFLSGLIHHGIFDGAFAGHAAELIASIDGVTHEWRWR